MGHVLRLAFFEKKCEGRGWGQEKREEEMRERGETNAERGFLVMLWSFLALFGEGSFRIECSGAICRAWNGADAN